MNKALLKEAHELTPDERIELVGEIWDSIAAHEMPPADRGAKAEIELSV